MNTGGLVGLLIRSFLLNEVLGSIFTNGIDVTDFVLEFDAVALVSYFNQLGAKRGRDELGTVSQSVYHRCE